MEWLLWFIALGFILVAFYGAGKNNAIWDANSDELEKTLASHDEAGWHSAERRREQK